MKKLLTTSALVAAIALPQIAAADAHSDLDPNAKSGGNITVTYKDDVATLDPAIGYDWQNWSMIKSLYDGLMDYEPGTTELRPGLAESYDISEDGKVFTFKLREGVKFHNGRVMTADDVKYTLDRVTNPATQSPGAGFFGSIEGYDAVSSGEVTELSGVKVLDEQTVEITLSRPDATFLHVMGLNFASVVAKEAVEAAGADFGKTAMGTGAFKLADWTIGQKLVFEKIRITGAKDCPIWIASLSRWARSRLSHCYVFKMAKSTYLGTVFHQRNSKRSWVIPNKQRA